MTTGNRIYFISKNKTLDLLFWGEQSIKANENMHDYDDDSIV